MPEHEKNKTPEEIKFESFKNNYLDVLKDQDVSDVQKVLLRQVDILMVLGKLKPMTELDFQKENIEEWEKGGYWQEGDLDKFQQLLKEKFKLQISNEFREGKNAHFVIFDVEQVKGQIKKYPDLLAWDEKKKDLQEWIIANKNAGKKGDYVLGVCQGFPKSAIEYYLKEEGFMDKAPQMIETYGENYGVPPGEMADDVKAREESKKRFFNQYNNDKEIQAELSKTDELKAEIVKINKQISDKYKNKR